jgi:four helix bundle protein
MRNHLNLQVLRKARDLTLVIYELTRGFPRDERFGLTAQVRRAAVSVVSNVAEGAARRSDREFARFLDVALGSAAELDAQLDISTALGFVDKDRATAVVDDLIEVKKMLAGLLASVLQRSSGSGSGVPGSS